MYIKLTLNVGELLENCTEEAIRLKKILKGYKVVISIGTVLIQVTNKSTPRSLLKKFHKEFKK